MVRDARGPLAEVVLDSVEVLDGQSTLKRFREVEIELTDGRVTEIERRVLRMMP